MIAFFARRKLNKVSRNARGKLVFQLDKINERYRDEVLVGNSPWDKGYLVCQGTGKVNLYVGIDPVERVASLTKEDAKLVGPLMLKVGNNVTVEIRWSEGRTSCFLMPVDLGLEP